MKSLEHFASGRTRGITKLILLSVLAIFLVPGSAASACSAAIPSTIANCRVHDQFIRETTVCIDDACRYEARLIEPGESAAIVDTQMNYRIGRLQETGVELYGFSFNREDLRVLDDICIADLSDVVESLLNQEWAVTEYAFHSRDIVIEPYGMEREQELKFDNSVLHSCSYHPYFRVGNWMASRQTLRSYCHPSSGLLNVCAGSSAAISPLAFLGFLLNEPDASKLVYLFFIALPLISISVATVHLNSNGHLASALTPNRWTLYLMVAAFVIFGCIAAWSTKDALIYWVVSYVPISYALHYANRSGSDRKAA